jgi:hypothetical protein
MNYTHTHIHAYRYTYKRKQNRTRQNTQLNTHAHACNPTTQKRQIPYTAKKQIKYTYIHTHTHTHTHQYVTPKQWERGLYEERRSACLETLSSLTAHDPRFRAKFAARKDTIAILARVLASCGGKPSRLCALRLMCACVSVSEDWAVRLGDDQELLRILTG